MVDPINTFFYNDHTLQECHDHIVQTMRKQGRASVNAAGICSYRGVGLTVCAFGAVIPDERYSALFETRSVFSLKALSDIPEFAPGLDYGYFKEM